jgi:hypothetical protein
VLPSATLNHGSREKERRIYHARQKEIGEEQGETGRKEEGRSARPEDPKGGPEGG